MQSILAMELSRQYHSGQVDKCGAPYINHPIAVMDILFTDNDDLKAVALLHDVLEDCEGVTSDMLLLQGVKPGVVTAVKALTKLEGENYWEYIDRVKINYMALRVKLADLKHNGDMERLYHTRDKEFVGIAGRYAKAYYILRDWEDTHWR